ncbi:hypothetical protein I317_07729 [Kwoniella heveanensis CBS 569]|nr:hypothetical protein I317_07729 [Kwoniella heveanensis CBS 569]
MSFNNLDSHPYYPLIASTARFLGPFIASSTAGSILTLSYYSIPIIRSTSTEHSTKTALHQLRALFSSGSHVFPPLAFAATTCYAISAYVCDDPAHRRGYIVAAMGSIGIAPFTTLVMLPAANQRLIDLDEKAKKGDLDGVKNSKEVDELLRSFEWLNAIRAGIMAVGATVGLWTALN